MTREEVRARIEDTGIIPAIRVQSAKDAIFAANAVFNGGILIAELTTTVPDATKIIAELMRVNPDVAKELKTNNGRLLNEMEELTKRTIIVKSDPALHQEQFDIN